MTPEAAIGALLDAERRLVALLPGTPGAAREVALRALARALDEVLLAYDGLPPCAPDEREGSDAYEPRDHGAAIRAAFPEFGMYWVAAPDPVDQPAGEPMVGDAVDDLDDILNELASIRWRAEAWGASAAAYHAALMQGHCLMHLLALRRYLHRLLFGW
jgi:hypothetical protein